MTVPGECCTSFCASLGGFQKAALEPALVLVLLTQTVSDLRKSTVRFFPPFFILSRDKLCPEDSSNQPFGTSAETSRGTRVISLCMSVHVSVHSESGMNVTRDPL